MVFTVHVSLYPCTSRQLRLKNTRRSSFGSTTWTNVDAKKTNNRRWWAENNDVWSAVCRNHVTTNRSGDRGEKNQSDLPVAQLHNKLPSCGRKYTGLQLCTSNIRYYHSDSTWK